MHVHSFHRQNGTHTFRHKYIFVYKLVVYFISFVCRLDLLPFYARLVATLHPCMSDVAEDLCSMLKGDFRFHVCFVDLVFCIQISQSDNSHPLGSK